MARHVGRKFVLVLLLAWVGGFVDAIGFMTLYRLFTAHMSGNSVEFGVAVGTGVGSTALQKGVPIAVFVAGVAIGTVANELSVRRGIRSTMAAPLFIEGVLLAAYLAWADSHLGPNGVLQAPLKAGYYLAAVLLVLAMGVQNSTLRRAGGERVRTTYITSVLTDLADALVGWAFAAHDRGRDDPDADLAGLAAQRRREALVLGGVWLIYTIGGISGAVTHRNVPYWSPVVPLVVIVALLAAELRRPDRIRDLTRSPTG